MSAKNFEKYSDKHGDAVQMDETVADRIRSRARSQELPCAVAFDIASDLQCDPAKVGQTTDLLNYRLSKCQLGLFGYRPEKKIVKAALPAEPQLVAAIKTQALDGKVTCKDAWELAARFEVSKMTVSAGCEALGIKVKPCQLGAF